MSRTFFAVVTAAVLVTAMPALAIEQHGPENQTASQPVAGAVGGGGMALTVGATAPVATVPNERFVTGQVVLSTPSEVALHTATRLREFAISSGTDETLAPVEGETVTVGYVPEKGTVVIGTAQTATTSQGPVRVAEATAPAIERPVQNAMNAAGPAESTPSAAAEPAESTPATPAASPAAAKVVHRMTRLPKTASDRPLILLAGLLAVAAAGTLRLALRA